MGMTYTVLLMDEFDWDYVGKKKDDRLADILSVLNAKNSCVKLEASWYRHAAIELDKLSPLKKEVGKLLLDNSDCVYYWTDIQPWDKQLLREKDLY